MLNTIKKIDDKLKLSGADFTLNEDMYIMCYSLMQENPDDAIEYLKKLKAKLPQVVMSYARAGDNKLAYKFMDLHQRTLHALARYDLDSYCLFLEWDRQPQNKFYEPRRKALYKVVTDLQALADDKLDLLTISLPPGVGKTTIAIFTLTWLAGKIPDAPILGSSHNTSFLRGVYDEMLRIIRGNGGEYLWRDVFPEVPLIKTNAKDLRIDLGKSKRFETLQFSSVGSGNAGKVRAETLLYCDDLVGGQEEALSRDRMEKLWELYTTDLRQRKIGQCKELHIATRWSVHDVIGKLEVMYPENPRVKFVRYPALDENGESNFDYGNAAGFTTEFYLDMRDSMDPVSFRALYMNDPIEREGLVYDEDELRRYTELPDREPDAVIGVCDTKDRGNDYYALPVAYVYGNDYYIEDAVCDNGMPDIVDAKIVSVLMQHKVGMARFESNAAGGRIAKSIQKEITERGGNTVISTKYNVQNKETRIIVNSQWVKKHCIFKDKSTYKRNSDYGRFMTFLCSYTTSGKNKNDDVPDAMANLADFAQSLSQNTAEVFKRPF